MIVTIHQPNYFPYPGFFHKLASADIFVIMDDVQYQYDHTNRNKIIANNPQGWTRIAIPTKKQHKFFPICDVEINNEFLWREKNWSLIYNSYGEAKFFHLYRDYLENLYKKEWTNLFAINFEIIKKLIEWLDIKVKLVLESELNVSGNSTERLVSVCKSVGASVYVSGMGGKQYLDEKQFSKNNINLVYQNYKPIVYPQQLSKSFIQNLSVLDLLMNIGPDSSKLVKNKLDDS